MKLTIGHLYPDLLNLYGDRGNIQCLMKRCQWRGIEAETIAYEIDDTIDFSKLDIVLLGGCLLYTSIDVPVNEMLIVELYSK